MKNETCSLIQTIPGSEAHARDPQPFEAPSHSERAQPVRTGHREGARGVAGGTEGVTEGTGSQGAFGEPRSVLQSSAVLTNGQCLLDRSSFEDLEFLFARAQTDPGRRRDSWPYKPAPQALRGTVPPRKAWLAPWQSEHCRLESLTEDGDGRHQTQQPKHLLKAMGLPPPHPPRCTPPAPKGRNRVSQDPRVGGLQWRLGVSGKINPWIGGKVYICVFLCGGQQPAWEASKAEKPLMLPHILDCWGEEGLCHAVGGQRV